MEQGRIVVIIGALVAVVLQILVAPHVTLFGAVPNFLLAFSLVTAIIRAGEYNPVLPFVLGLFFDLFTGGPVGAMAFSLMLFSYIASVFFSAADNDTLFIPLFTLIVGIFLTEFSYGMFLMLFGYPAGFFEALAYRVAPCFVYDFIVAVVLYFALRRILAPQTTGMTNITQLR